MKSLSDVGKLLEGEPAVVLIGSVILTVGDFLNDMAKVNDLHMKYLHRTSAVNINSVLTTQ